MAAAAAGFSQSPFMTGLPAGYHLAPAGNPFIQYGKYIAQQPQIINQSGLLQPTNIQANGLQAALTQQQQNSVSNQAATAALTSTPYGLNQHLVNSSPATNSSTGLANGQANPSLLSSQINSQAGQMMFPIIQNLNEEVS